LDPGKVASPNPLATLDADNRTLAIDIAFGKTARQGNKPILS